MRSKLSYMKYTSYAYDTGETNLLLGDAVRFVSSPDRSGHIDHYSELGTLGFWQARNIDPAIQILGEYINDDDMGFCEEGRKRAMDYFGITEEKSQYEEVTVKSLTLHENPNNYFWIGQDGQPLPIRSQQIGLVPSGAMITVLRKA